MIKLKMYIVRSVHNFKYKSSVEIKLIQAMNMSKKALRNLCVTLVLITLFSVVFVSVPTRIANATPTISSISPSSGFVEDTVTVNGAIDTPDGSFTIRWNQTLNVTAGQASGLNVAASFRVPQTVGAPAPLGRNVTIELVDNSVPSFSSPLNFTLYTKLDVSLGTPVAPNQPQEGSAIPITVNVAGGEANKIYTANITVVDSANQTHSIFPSLSNTTTIGSGEKITTYPTDFTGAHTNYTGNYTVTFNGTVTRKFQVGLTDKIEYRRNETVQIKATGYKSSEVVIANIRTGGFSVADFPKNVSANSGGVVTLSWKIPLNTTPGTYGLSITNSTSGGTVKTPSDSQKFEVLGVICKIQTTNLAAESVAGASVEVYNATALQTPLTKGSTNSTGWIRFNLDGGNYIFKAFVKNVEVGSRPQNVTVDSDFTLQMDLVNVVATVETEAREEVPLIDIAMNYNYTTRNNSTVSETASLLTNLTGIAVARNLFENTTYRVEAKRHGLLFNSTILTIGLSPSSPLNFHLTLPTYTLNIHALDSQNKPAGSVEIRVYEWATGVTNYLQTSETSGSGDTSFALPFGKYRLRAYEGNAFLNETAVDLDENPKAFTFYLASANVDVTVSAFDYIGQPIANAEVKIERKINQEYVLVDSKSTDTSGSVVFSSIVGGNSRISVYVAGRLAAVKTLFLGTGSNQVTFNIGEYVALLGYPIETGMFTLFSLILVLIVVFVFLERKRVIAIFGKKLKR